MSFLVHYRNGELIYCGVKEERQVPSPIYACKDGKTLCLGELFGFSFEELAAMEWEENPNCLNTVAGSKAIVRADVGRCTFAVDMCGIDTLFYYHRNGTFLLSDSFWAIVRVVQPSYEDLDAERIRQELLTVSSEGECIIKGMKLLLPNHIGIYLPAEDRCSVTQYKEFRYSGEVTDVQEAVSNMDRILHESMEQIKAKFGDVSYGVGISGGLDSRVIPHYAIAHEMELEGFNICTAKPHGLFLARSIISAKKIAKAFQIPFSIVDWNPAKVQQKIDDAVRLYPIDSGGCSFKYETKNMPEFQVLLTGGSGMIVGSELPPGLAERDPNALSTAMQSEFLPSSSATFSSRVIRAIRYITGLSLSWCRGGAEKRPFSSVLNEESYQLAESSLHSYIRSRAAKGMSGFEIYEDYFQNVVGFRNRFGAHESLLGTKRSLSIYIPFLYQETLRWSQPLLENRIVLETLIREKIPEVASIRGESFKTSVGRQKTGPVLRAVSILTFLIRGNGTAIDEAYMKRPAIRKKYLHFVNEESGTWFRRVFGLEQGISTSAARRESARANVCIWQSARLLKCLENKEYLDPKFFP